MEAYAKPWEENGCEQHHEETAGDIEKANGHNINHNMIIGA